MKNKILEIIAVHNRITVSDLRRKDKGAKEEILVEARQLACFFLREKLDLSLPQIGKIVNRNHATVLYSIRKVQDFLETDKEYSYRFDKLKNDIDILFLPPETFEEYQRLIITDLTL